MFRPLVWVPLALGLAWVIPAGAAEPDKVSKAREIALGAAPAVSRGALVAIVGALFVVLVGGIVAVMLMGRAAPAQVQGSASNPPMTAATGNAAASVEPRAPEPPPSVLPEVASATAPSAQPIPTTTDGKIGKPQPSASTKKPSRDLGY